MTNNVKLSRTLNHINLTTNALEVNFETSKKFEICPFHLVVNCNRPLLVILNIPLIMEITRTMSVALQNEKLDFDYFIQMALNHILVLRNRTQDLAERVKKGDYEHQNVSFVSVIQAPIGILPSDIFNINSSYLRVDLGEINAKSQLLKYKRNYDYRSEMNEAELYDSYNLSVNGLSISICDPEIQKEPHKVLEDVEVSVSLCPCLEPLHPVFPSFKCNFEFVKDLEIDFDWTTVDQLLKMFNIVIVQLENKLYLKVATHLLKPSLEKNIQGRRTAIDDKFDANTENEEGVRQRTNSLIRTASLARERRMEVQQEVQRQPSLTEVAGSSMSVTFNMKKLQVTFNDTNVYDPDQINHQSCLGLRVQLDRVQAKVKVESDQETILAELTLHQLEIIDITDPDDFSKIAFWHKLDDRPDEPQHRNTICDFSPLEHESQLSCKAKILLSMIDDKYKPEELTDVKDADIQVVLNHSILSMNMPLIVHLINNANHAFQLQKNIFAKKKEISQLDVKGQIETLRRRNEIKSTEERRD